jgi:hypothetical protein
MDDLAVEKVFGRHNSQAGAMGFLKTGESSKAAARQSMRRLLLNASQGGGKKGLCRKSKSGEKWWQEVEKQTRGKITSFIFRLLITFYRRSQGTSRFAQALLSLRSGSKYDQWFQK